LSSHDDKDKEFRKPDYGKVDFDRQVGEKHEEEIGGDNKQSFFENYNKNTVSN
jgi:hypothetical protein